MQQNQATSIESTGASPATSSRKRGPAQVPKPQTPAPKPLTSLFACPLCSKLFSSGQALGGHQNAHRFERKNLRVISPATEALFSRSSAFLSTLPRRADPVAPLTPNQAGPGPHQPGCSGLHFHSYHHYARPVHQTGLPSVGGAHSGRSSERTESDPIDVGPVGDEVEGAEVSSKSEEIDLELRLGTGYI